MASDSYFYWFLAVTALTILHYVTVARQQGVLTLDGIFVLSQWVMVTGTMLILDPSVASDNFYALVIAAPAVIYLLVSMLVFHARPRSRRAERTRVTIVRPTGVMWGLLVFAAAVSVAYYMSVGYNVLLQGLRGTGEDYTSLRLNSYGGSRYLFPGYVNQFKNTIFPLMAVSVAAYLIAMRKTGRWLFTVVASVGILLAVMGTGQRGAFIQLSLTILTFLYLLDRSRFGKRAALALCVVLPPIFFSTLILGRSANGLATASSPFAVVNVLFDELSKRIFHDNQFSGQFAFRYVADRPTQWGHEWAQGVLGILPGNPGTSLAREVFAMLYGTDRGTAPISMWGSVYYNWGLVGVFVGAALLGVVFQSWTMRLVRSTELNLVELLGMSSFFVILGNWVQGGPEYLLNAGLFAAAFVWWLGHRIPANRVVGVLGGAAPETTATDAVEMEAGR